MNDQYAAYLESEAWQQKRMQRLQIGRFRCAACTKAKAVHVHHLTYERIFNEDMADLLPLCEDHHEAAEKLIKAGKLTRTGEVLFLASETIRLILATKLDRVTALASVEIHGRILIARNSIQSQLLKDRAFVAVLQCARSRHSFKAHVHQLFRREKKGLRNTHLCNAFALFDRASRNTYSEKIIKPQFDNPGYGLRRAFGARSLKGLRG